MPTPRGNAHLNYGRALLIAALFVWGVAGLKNWNAFAFVHGVDLLIHEFGHPFFGIFGNEVLGILGGSLMQLIVPLLFVGYFFLARQPYAGTVIVFWFAQSVTDVAVYVRDAPTMALNLIGGNGDGVIHDWNYLLTHWDALAKASGIAGAMDFVAGALFLGMLVAGLYFSIETEEPPLADW